MATAGFANANSRGADYSSSRHRGVPEWRAGRRASMTVFHKRQRFDADRAGTRLYWQGNSLTR